MARACSVCANPRRSDIDAAFVAGESIRAIAGRFAIPRSNLARHAPHVQAQVHAAQEAHVLDVAQHVKAVAGVAVGIMSRGDDRARISAGGLLLRTCEFVHAMDVDQRQRELEARLTALEEALAGSQDSRTNGRTHTWSSVN